MPITDSLKAQPQAQSSAQSR